MNYIQELRKLVGSRRLINVGGRIIIENADKHILLIHRSDFKLWGLPSGSIELGESLEDAMIRETFEETGLKINQLKIIGVSSDPLIENVSYPNGDMIQNVSLVFYSNDFDGVLLKATNETTNAAFFPIDELPEMVKNERQSIAFFKTYCISKEVFLK